MLQRAADDQMAGSIFAKLQTSTPGEAFRAAIAGGGVPAPHVQGGTCQRNLPAQARHKNEARPAYTIPGVPMPIRPAPEQPSTRPKARPSPSRPGLKDKAKATPHQKAGEMKDRVKALHEKVSSIILGNKDKKK
ncbi:hypothetical protein C2845_PM12G08510 [Panicum miliaceum]|uniref:Uncharacterized protein n=1 Tax=Panicum miliaceum TaxID=4540 RepID=A0A3L6QHJ4_PANMI|nr:hypothetical protein C2845_PM12G08510 [Panicum miliaceum]